MLLAVDDETGSFAQGLTLPSILDPLMQSDMSLAPSLTQFDKDASLHESLDFVATHFKASTPPAAAECDEDKFAVGLSFPDVHDMFDADNEPLAPSSSSSALKATADVLVDGSQRLLGHLQHNLPVATELLHRGATAIVSTAYSGITALSDVVKHTATTISDSGKETSGTHITQLNVDDESIDKDFEFLNQEELTEAEQSSN